MIENVRGRNNFADAETSGRKLGRYARLYDMFVPNMHRAKAVIDIWPPSKGERVLEVGCGPGALSIALKKVVGPQGEVDAIDAAAGMIEVAAKKGLKIEAGVRFKVSAIEKLPFGDVSFDKVYASLMIHHLPPDAKNEGFREVHRVLKKGGSFLIVDFGRPSNWLVWTMTFPMWLSEKYFFSNFSAIKAHFQGKLPEMLIGAGFHETRLLKKSFGFMDYLLAIK